MKVHVMDLSPGHRLENDIFNNNGVFVLQKGAHLTDEAIVKLMQHGIDYVDIVPLDAAPEDDKPVMTPSMQKMKPHFDQAVDVFETIFLESLSNGRFSEDQIDDTLQPLMGDLMSQKDIVSLLFLFDGKDNYTYNHSLQVGMLSYYIASWLGYPKEEAYKAGKAGYLHDIGKCMVPPHILNKPGALTPEEFEEVKKHTTYGYDIIRNSTSDEITALVALQHHEREDGSGYPHSIFDKEIHPFAKITAVADVYSAMTSNRVYQSKQELLTVLQELYRMSFGKLSPEPIQALVRHMLPNFIGKKVLLSSGETGLIVMNNPADYFRPLVKTELRFADLSKEREIDIQEIYI
ncbi:HD family phosphohydrolase [Paenibacillus sp. CAA11]|uniref:HD-GYP domain-containing protein n=1 Tax=Paenibacillus sp. CAA11 TaxID=1532905 RepID=UPI000D39477A|nr:HD-GYP domain-containing protein [Paenibacillus sp. CAA11]AWB44021.1 HD family phosphohydrolase [Paenibacillus sp. CAA11]